MVDQVLETTSGFETKLQSLDEYTRSTLVHN